MWFRVATHCMCAPLCVYVCLAFHGTAVHIRDTDREATVKDWAGWVH